MLHNKVFLKNLDVRKNYNFFKLAWKLRRYVPLDNFKPKFVAFFVAAGMVFSSISCISSLESSWNQFFSSLIRFPYKVSSCVKIVLVFYPCFDNKSTNAVGRFVIKTQWPQANSGHETMTCVTFQSDPNIPMRPKKSLSKNGSLEKTFFGSHRNAGSLRNVI